MQGVLLLALGHAYYAKMALNLLLSIREADLTTPVHIVLGDYYKSDVKNPLSISVPSAWDWWQHNVPQQIKDLCTAEICPRDYYFLKDKPVYHAAKTYLDLLTPFESTLYLDVDSIWFRERPVSALLQELDGQEFSVHHSNKNVVGKPETYSYYGWLEPKTVSINGEAETETTKRHCRERIELILEAYPEIQDGSTIYETQSSFMFWKKTDKTTFFFQKAREIFADCKIDPKHLWGGGWNGYLPDELAFNIASGIAGLEIKETPYHPFLFFDILETSGVIDSNLYTHYWGLSMAGVNFKNDTSKFQGKKLAVLRAYDARAVKANQKFKYDKPIYRWKDKNEFISTRKKA